MTIRPPMYNKFFLAGPSFWMLIHVTILVVWLYSCYRCASHHGFPANPQHPITIRSMLPFVEAQLNGVYFYGRTRSVCNTISSIITSDICHAFPLLLSWHFGILFIDQKYFSYSNPCLIHTPWPFSFPQRNNFYQGPFVLLCG